MYVGLDVHQDELAHRARSIGIAGDLGRRVRGARVPSIAAVL
jgi:hypothetical protein